MSQQEIILGISEINNEWNKRAVELAKTWLTAPLLPKREPLEQLPKAEEQGDAVALNRDQTQTKTSS